MLWAAYKKIRQNGEGAGVDCLSLSEFERFGIEHLAITMANHTTQIYITRVSNDIMSDLY